MDQKARRMFLFRFRITTKDSHFTHGKDIDKVHVQAVQRDSKSLSLNNHKCINCCVPKKRLLQP